MATMVLGAAGMALGGAIGGSVLGMSSAMIGRAVGASLGHAIDSRLLGAGSDPVETGRIDRLRLTGASEGAPIARVFGRARIGGQVIWASSFRERTETSGGGKGAPARPETVEYGYSVSLAVAVCTGEVTAIGRVWADGQEVPRHRLGMRVYPGSEDQLPDPAIAAVEGAENAPAYRGTAYVVFEDLDLGPFGNRVPAFSFEVSRPAGPDETAADGTPPDIARAVRGVALMPGSGEYTLATTPVTVSGDWAETGYANVNTEAGRADALEALDQLDDELPACESVSLVVSWFGSDLRAASCALRPKVEHHADTADMPWEVSGTDRQAAAIVPWQEGGPVYGGTPTDRSVIEIIREMTARGKSVVFYPFILMDQLAGNGLPDPWSGAPDQPHLPWRGRITLSVSPGRPGSPDTTAAADAEIAAFFGTAAPGDFTPTEWGVSYAGPQEWSYRRFILHYAHLCVAAGGVDAFCIGSEMRALTQVRGASGFPAVEALATLAGELRAILGPDCRIGYAADWSEYHGYQPPGTADKLFHLDRLWADDAIDFIGIDNYMPLSDWRDGTDHADAGWRSIHNLDYLRANLAGGEGHDWYYASEADRAAQLRTLIHDHFGEHWVWRYKDLAGWWDNYHHDRIDGERAAEPTAWEPGSKPIWFTEFGCAAIDKGTNQPNKFLDPKSSESQIPYFSNGYRDEFIQHQYLRATLAHWADPANNITSRFTGQRMIDMSRAHVWAWDARPFPAFPGRRDLWSDGANHERGHWITGRTAHRPLAHVVESLCREAGLHDVDTSRLDGLVRGYTLSDVATTRAALQPLMLAHGFDAVERGGVLAFRSRTALSDGTVTANEVALSDTQEERVLRSRAAEAELAGTVRVSFVETGGDHDLAAAEAIHPRDGSVAVTENELPLSLYRGEGQAMAERWLAEARVARDRVSLALPPSRADLGAGDVMALDGGLYRIDRTDTGAETMVEATKVDHAAYAAADPGPGAPALPAPRVPHPVEGLFLDLPLIADDAQAHAPWFGAVASPWPGRVALYASATGAGYALGMTRPRPARAGRTLSAMAWAPPGLVDNGPALEVQMASGTLSSAGMDAVLAGANLAAIGDGSPDNWELFQFTGAELVAPGRYALTGRLRGQAGSDGLMPPAWPAGSIFVLLDGRLAQLGLPAAARGTARHLRWGPAAEPFDHVSYRERVAVFAGNGLRPYPVCHFRAEAEGGGGVAMRWTRRTRIDGDGWDGTEVPLGEENEAYRVEIRAGGSVLRAAETDAPAFAYTAAMQVADGAPGQVEVAIAQLSARYGAGPARAFPVVL